MSDAFRLTLIKSLHTAIWIFFNAVIFYWLYAVTVGKIDYRLWICIGLVAAECLVLLLFKNVCPVTLVARKYSDSSRENFDIFLPNWLAKYNKQIYGFIVLICLILLVYRLL